MTSCAPAVEVVLAALSVGLSGIGLAIVQIDRPVDRSIRSLGSRAGTGAGFAPHLAAAACCIAALLCLFATAAILTR